MTMPPAPDGWTPHRHALGPCPVPADTQVMIRYRNGQEIGPVAAGSRRWDRFPDQREPTPWDIAAWRLVGCDE